MPRHPASVVKTSAGPKQAFREFFKLSKSDRKLSPEIVVQQTNTFHLLLILLDKSAESGEKFTHSMALQMLKIRSRRSAIEMATNEDKSHRTRDKCPRSAVTSARKLFVHEDFNSVWVLG